MDRSAEYIYTGKVSDETISAAFDSYRQYKADRENLIARIRDAERYYRSFYDRPAHDLQKHMRCTTSLLFSCIENAAAQASANYPVPNVLERDPQGSEAAEALSQVLPVQFEISRFRKTYNANSLNKLKYGSAVYGVFYDDGTDNIDIRAIDLMDIYVDMHLENLQDSRFMFISAAVDNDILKQQYPKFKELFTGDADVEGIGDSYRLENRSQILDCYYKKPDGTLHMMKLCDNVVIEATEDLDGYENGLYDHGLYPVVVDTMFPAKNSPFGFGMIDIGKATQIQIDKLDNAITKNAMVTARQRYFSKRDNGINAEEFADLDRDVVEVDGDLQDNVKAIEATSMNSHIVTHRENKKLELKELLANRDFQQGSTQSGVTAASAIEILRETGEKRSRKMSQDTYEAYKDIVYMTIELIRQFYSNPRTYRVQDEQGQKSFVTLDNSMLVSEQAELDETGEIVRQEEPIQFDIEVIPQTENPFTQEQQNNTMFTLWNSGFFLPQNTQQAMVALNNMDFKGRAKLVGDINKMLEEQQAQQQMMQEQQMQAQMMQEQQMQPQQGGVEMDMQGDNMSGDDLVAVQLPS